MRIDKLTTKFRKHSRTRKASRQAATINTSNPFTSSRRWSRSRTGPPAR